MSTDSPEPHPATSERLSGAQLSELYPKAKTYDDQLADQAERARRQLAHRPRFATFKVSFRLFLLAVAAALLITSTPVIIFTNVLAGVCIVVFLIIVLLAACKWQADEITSLMDKLGLNASGFLTAYFVAIGPLLALGLFAATTRFTGWWLAGMYALAFIVLLSLVGALLYQMRRK